ncbi:hypothetical protein QAD02_022203 [Eretmocerus hayati]|uniref:Uncharacterized protein n=1 Tax=Eretmocerus hayati TaxID=131215 RepID=A0ACC2PS39_9HYME|nr:hypothetical protein QAD02_022203 [Eretmocerus hayati]
MFENDDWDIDAEYLEDFNVDEVLGNIRNDGKSVEKPRIDEVAKNGTPNAFESRTSVPEETVKRAGSDKVDITSRKNAILDIFKNASNSPKTSFPCASSSDLNQPSHSAKKPLTPTIKVIDNQPVVPNAENESGTERNRVSAFQPKAKSMMRVPEFSVATESSTKSKKIVAFSEVLIETRTEKSSCAPLPNCPSVALNESEIQNDSHTVSVSGEKKKSQNTPEESRKKTILDLLRSPVRKRVKVPRLKQAVVRRFPGPAGLLPDDLNESEVVELDSVDESRNDSDNKYSEVCSQNTKNLFTTGAWQLMTDDLPADFELYDIASIKEHALESTLSFKKVPYLAGIIQSIDYKPNDPHVVLKDLSGDVEAVIHHSICKLYPEALGVNIVVLLKNVGIFKTSKDHLFVIITHNNVVSMYSDEARLVETPLLQDLSNSNDDDLARGSPLSILDETENQASDEML